MRKEIIVINDGSSDETYDLLKSKCNNLFDKLISYRIKG